MLQSKLLGTTSSSGLGTCTVVHRGSNGEQFPHSSIRADLATRGLAVSFLTLATVRFASSFVVFFFLAATIAIERFPSWFVAWLEWFPLWVPARSKIFRISVLNTAFTASDSRSPRATRLT